MGEGMGGGTGCWGGMYWNSIYMCGAMKVWLNAGGG